MENERRKNHTQGKSGAVNADKMESELVHIYSMTTSFVTGIIDGGGIVKKLWSNCIDLDNLIPSRQREELISRHAGSKLKGVIKSKPRRLKKLPLAMMA